MIDVVDIAYTALPRLAQGRFPDILWRSPAEYDEPTLYLTFDDGPTHDATPAVLDTLARHDVPASFFLIGARAALDRPLTRAIADAGHTVGNHTYTHLDAWRESRHRVQRELERTTRLLESITDRPVRHMRPPFGRFTTSMRAWCRENDQRCVLWDIAPGDWLPSTSAKRLARRVQRRIRPGSVVVLHDSPLASHCLTAGLDDLLTTLKDRGWRFEAL
jgi:peptidoglycan-N-acetylglucosamine deacetylase